MQVQLYCNIYLYVYRQNDIDIQILDRQTDNDGTI